MEEHDGKPNRRTHETLAEKSTSLYPPHMVSGEVRSGCRTGVGRRMEHDEQTAYILKNWDKQTINTGSCSHLSVSVPTHLLPPPAWDPEIDLIHLTGLYTVYMLCYTVTVTRTEVGHAAEIHNRDLSLRVVTAPDPRQPTSWKSD